MFEVLAGAAICVGIYKLCIVAHRVGKHTEEACQGGADDSEEK